jgi:hypothetical protein
MPLNQYEEPYYKGLLLYQSFLFYFPLPLTKKELKDLCPLLMCIPFQLLRFNLAFPILYLSDIKISHLMVSHLKFL